ncbi:hypothetical protein FPV67DRAFT_1460850 [Lyophyllum atratum]|nr:hypothetical protein FPV67DRAFT_1460850 [Lyophyllum atratum]
MFGTIEKNGAASIKLQMDREQELRTEEASALLGYGMLALKKSQDHPAVRLQFGKFNDRKLRTKDVEKMVLSFTHEGYNHRQLTSAIPVLVDPLWFENQNFLKNPALNETLPTITLKPDYQKASILALSGQHRFAAALVYLESFENDLQTKDQRLAKDLKVPKKLGQEEIAAKEEDIRVLKATLEEYKTWAFVFYDKGKASQRLCSHLSRNQATHDYNETEEDRLALSLRNIRSAQLGQDQEKACLVAIEGTRNPKSSSLLRSKHARPMLIEMIRAGSYYRQSDIFNIRWLSSAFLGVHGAILAFTISRGIRRLIRLFSASPFPTIAEVMATIEAWNKTWESPQASPEYKAVQQRIQSVAGAFELGEDLDDHRVPASLLSKIDAIAQEQFGTAPRMLGQDTPKYREGLEAYKSQVRDLFAGDAVKWKTPEAKVVALARLEWLLTCKEGYACELPLMTEWVIKTLHESLNMVPEALKECVIKQSYTFVVHTYSRTQVTRWFSPMVDHVLIQNKDNEQDYSAYIKMHIDLRWQSKSDRDSVWREVVIGIWDCLWTHLAPLNGYFLEMDPDYERVTSKDAFQVVFGEITEECVKTSKAKASKFVVSDKDIDLSIHNPPGDEHGALQQVLTFAGWKEARAGYIKAANSMREGTSPPNDGGTYSLLHATPWVLEPKAIKKNYKRVISMVGAAAAERAFLVSYRPDLLLETPAVFEWPDGLLCMDHDHKSAPVPTVLEGYTNLEVQSIILDTSRAVQRVLRPIERSKFAKSSTEDNEKAPICIEVFRALATLLWAFEVNTYRQRTREVDPDAHISRKAVIPHFQRSRTKFYQDKNTSDFEDTDHEGVGEDMDEEECKAGGSDEDFDDGGDSGQEPTQGSSAPDISMGRASWSPHSTDTMAQDLSMGLEAGVQSLALDNPTTGEILESVDERLDGQSDLEMDDSMVSSIQTMDRIPDGEEHIADTAHTPEDVDMATESSTRKAAAHNRRIKAKKAGQTGRKRALSSPESKRGAKKTRTSKQNLEDEYELDGAEGVMITPRSRYGTIRYLIRNVHVETQRFFQLFGAKFDVNDKNSTTIVKVAVKRKIGNERIEGGSCIDPMTHRQIPPSVTLVTTPKLSQASFEYRLNSQDLLIDEYHKGATIASQILRENDLKEQQAEALLGYGMLYLTPSGDNSGIILAFGHYNDRQLKDKELEGLKNSFDVRGYLNTEPKNAIPVLVRPEWFIKDDFLKSPLPGQTLPTMQMKPEYAILPVTALSGQHRFQAAKEVLKKLENEKEKAEQVLEKGKRPRNLLGDEQIEKERKAIEEMKIVFERCKQWAFVFYDLEKASTELCNHLSRNEAKHVYKEAEEDRLVLSLREIIEAEKDSPEAVQKAISSAQAEAARRKTKASALLQTEHARAALLIMTRTGSYYRQCDLFSLRWLSKALLGIHGAILGAMIRSGLLALGQLFNSSPFPSVADIKNDISHNQKRYLMYEKESERSDLTPEENRKILEVLGERDAKYEARWVTYRNGTPEFQLITAELLTTIDLIAKENFEDEPWVLGQDCGLYWDKLHAYKLEVRHLLNTKAVEWASGSAEERLVAKAITGRLEWLFTAHPGYAQSLPIMTEWVIQQVQINLSGVPEAVKEVTRWFSPLVDHVLEQSKETEQDYSAYIKHGLQVQLQGATPDARDMAWNRVVTTLWNGLWTHMAPLNTYILGIDTDFERVTSKETLQQVFGELTSEPSKGRKAKATAFGVGGGGSVNAPPGDKNGALQRILISAGWEAIRSGYLEAANSMRAGHFSRSNGDIYSLMKATPWVLSTDAMKKNIKRATPQVGAAAAEWAYIKHYRQDLLNESPGGSLRETLGKDLEKYCDERSIQDGIDTRTIQAFEWPDHVSADPTCEAVVDILDVEAGHAAFEIQQIINDAALAIQKVLRPVERSPYALLENRKGGKAPVCKEVSAAVSQLLQRTRQDNPTARISKKDSIPRIPLIRMQCQADTDTSDFDEEEPEGDHTTALSTDLEIPIGNAHQSPSQAAVTLEPMSDQSSQGVHEQSATAFDSLFSTTSQTLDGAPHNLEEGFDSTVGSISTVKTKSRGKAVVTYAGREGRKRAPSSPAWVVNAAPSEWNAPRPVVTMENISLTGPHMSPPIPPTLASRRSEHSHHGANVELPFASRMKTDRLTYVISRKTNSKMVKNAKEKIATEPGRMKEKTRDTDRCEGYRREFFLGSALVRVVASNGASPVNFLFGKYNWRGLSTTEVDSMVANFRAEGMRNKYPENAIPCIIDPVSVETTQLVKDRLAAEFPKVEFPSSQVLVACSGQHREAAARRFMEQLQDQKKDLLKEIADGDRSTKKGKSKADNADEVNSVILRAKDTLAVVEEQIRDAPWWLVDFYSSAGPEELWNYLSRNAHAHVYGEAAEDQFLQALRIIEKEPTKLDETIERAAQTKFAGLLSSPYSRNTCLNMISYGPYFPRAAIFKNSWLIGAFLSVHGGILGCLVNHSLRLLRGLFSASEFYSSADIRALIEDFNERGKYIDAQITAIAEGQSPDTSKDAAMKVASSPTISRLQALEDAKQALNDEIQAVDAKFFSGAVETSLITVVFLDRLDTDASNTASRLKRVPQKTGQHSDHLRDYVKKALITLKLTFPELRTHGYTEPQKIVVQFIAPRFEWMCSELHGRPLPLPIFTTTVIEAVHESFSTTPEAIKEVVRWFHPIVDHTLEIKKQSLHSSSAYLLDALRSAQFISNDNLTERQEKVSRKIFDLRPHLLVLEIHIRNNPASCPRLKKASLAKIFQPLRDYCKSIKVPRPTKANPRRTTRSKPLVIEEDEDELDANLPSGKDADNEKVNDFLEDITWKNLSRLYVGAFKAGRAKAMDLATADHEVLTYLMGDGVWTYPPSKNFHRDFIPLVDAAVFEYVYAQWYRKSLLGESAAGVIRKHLESCLRSYTVDGVRWADKLEVSCSLEEEDVRKIAGGIRDVQKKWDAEEAITKLLHTLYRSPYVMLKENGTEVAPEVSRAIGILKKALEINVLLCPLKSLTFASTMGKGKNEKAGGVSNSGKTLLTSALPHVGKEIEKLDILRRDNRLGFAFIKISDLDGQPAAKLEFGLKNDRKVDENQVKLTLKSFFSNGYLHRQPENALRILLSPSQSHRLKDFDFSQDAIASDRTPKLPLMDEKFVCLAGAHRVAATKLFLERRHTHQGKLEHAIDLRDNPKTQKNKKKQKKADSDDSDDDDSDDSENDNDEEPEALLNAALTETKENISTEVWWIAEFYPSTIASELAIYLSRNQFKHQYAESGDEAIIELIRNYMTSNFDADKLTKESAGGKAANIINAPHALNTVCSLLSVEVGSYFRQAQFFHLKWLNERLVSVHGGHRPAYPRYQLLAQFIVNGVTSISRIFSKKPFPSAKTVHTAANNFRTRQTDLVNRTARLPAGDETSDEALAIKAENTKLVNDIRKMDKEFGPLDFEETDEENRPRVPLGFLDAVDPFGVQLLASFLARSENYKGYLDALDGYRTHVGNRVKQDTLTLAVEQKASISGRFAYLMEILPGRPPPFPLLTASTVVAIDVALARVPGSIKEALTLRLDVSRWFQPLSDHTELKKKGDRDCSSYIFSAIDNSPQLTEETDRPWLKSMVAFDVLEAIESLLVPMEVSIGSMSLDPMTNKKIIDSSWKPVLALGNNKSKGKERHQSDPALPTGDDEAPPETAKAKKPPVKGKPAREDISVSAYQTFLQEQGWEALQTQWDAVFNLLIANHDKWANIDSDCANLEDPIVRILRENRTWSLGSKKTCKRDCTTLISAAVSVYVKGKEYRPDLLRTTPAGRVRERLSGRLDPQCRLDPSRGNVKQFRWLDGIEAIKPTITDVAIASLRQDFPALQRKGIAQRHFDVVYKSVMQSDLAKMEDDGEDVSPEVMAAMSLLKQAFEIGEHRKELRRQNQTAPFMFADVRSFKIKTQFRIADKDPMTNIDFPTSLDGSTATMVLSAGNKSSQENSERGEFLDNQIPHLTNVNLAFEDDVGSQGLLGLADLSIGPPERGASTHFNAKMGSPMNVSSAVPPDHTKEIDPFGDSPLTSEDELEGRAPTQRNEDQHLSSNATGKRKRASDSSADAPLDELKKETSKKSRMQKGVAIK